jgi:hypothetical protein
VLAVAVRENVDKAGGLLDALDVEETWDELVSGSSATFLFPQICALQFCCACAFPTASLTHWLIHSEHMIEGTVEA